MSDFYYDDPVEETTGTRRNFKNILALILVIAVGGTYLQTTLAANINLNSGLVIEFGQGVSATTACSGSTSLVVTPASSFVNSSGGGAFYFSSVKVANIPSSCHGKDFTINAYNNSSNTPLAIFNGTSTSAVVYNNAGTFQLGAGTTVGASITSGSGTFTLTFTTPVAAATSVFKLTIQSSNHAQVDGVYSVGDTGPGGGKIFYYSAAGFNCGASYSATGSPTSGKCNYLEVAPSLWSGLLDGDDNPDRDTAFVWALDAYKVQDVFGITNDALDDGLPRLALEIGLGYKNSIAIINQGNGVTTAAGAARAYTGGSKSDWYLPTYSETNLLCQWAKGQTQNPAVRCTSGSPNAQTGTDFALLFDPDPYWSPVYWTSTERTAEVGSDEAYFVQFYTGQVEASIKDNGFHVRPIRAF